MRIKNKHGFQSGRIPAIEDQHQPDYSHARTTAITNQEPQAAARATTAPTILNPRAQFRLLELSSLENNTPH